MAGSHDYFLSGDHEAGKNVVAGSLAQQGFEVTSTPKGGLFVARGSKAKTLWLGGAAGKNFRVSFVVEYFADAHGNLVARFNRELGGGMLKGGAIGAGLTTNAFSEAASALHQQLAGSQLLVGYVENA